MKTNFLKHFIGASLCTVLLVACGKEAASKKSPIADVLQDPNQITAQDPNAFQNVNATGQQARNNFAAWYNSTTEATYPSIGPKYVTRGVTQYGQSSSCQSRPLDLFGISFGNINMCFNSSTAAQPVLTTTIVNIVHSGLNKSANSRIANIDVVNNKSQYGNIADVKQQGTIFIFTIMRNNTYDTLVIDTGINSAVNPIYLSDNANRKEEGLVSIR